MNSMISSETQRPMSPVLRAGLMQICLTVFTSLILDGGIVCHVFLRISLGFWCGLLLIALRRWSSPTKSDLWYLRHGLWCVLFLSFPIATTITDLSGGFPHLIQALNRR